jgi:hypothetical protein
LWLADRPTNPAYLRPDLHVCFDALTSMDGLVSRLATEPSGYQGCSRQPIVQRALSGKPERTLPNAAILARDAENDSWAILRLEWTSSDW